MKTCIFALIAMLALASIADAGRFRDRRQNRRGACNAQTVSSPYAGNSCNCR